MRGAATRGGTHNLANVAVTAGALQAVLIVIPLMKAVVAIDNLAASGSVEMAAAASGATQEVHALVLPLLLSLIMLMSSESGKSKACKQASSSYCSERHF